jgi:membrane protease YdiL (CAAX protease family)
MTSSCDAVTPSRSPLRTAAAMYLWMVLLIGIEGQVWCFAADWLLVDERWLWVHEVFAFAIAIVVLRHVWADPAARRVWQRPRPRVVELCVVVGTAGALLLVMWETNIPGGGPIGYEQHRDAGWPVWLMLLCGALAPAVIEELAFRGLMQQGLLGLLGMPLAIALQAALFALVHLNHTYLLPHFVFGAIAGVLRVAAGALWPCMLMHLAWNGWLVLDVYGVI